MASTLIELTLGESSSLEGMGKQSFNNDSSTDKIRNSFCEQIPHFYLNKEVGERIPPEYLYPNVYISDLDEIYKKGEKVFVGKYCNKGLIVPKSKLSIIFNKLHDCAPLISHIKGDEEYISFLHIWETGNDFGDVDRQVKNWMETISRVGEVSETVFAPRKKRGRTLDTTYTTAVDDIKKVSKKTIVFTRDINQLKGIVNRDGVYFEECGYHLWDN
jgi:hypothetical protein